MKRFIFPIFTLVMIFTFAGCSNESGGSSGTLDSLSIGAGTIGGGFHSGGTAVSSVINDNLEGVQANVEVTGSSVNNVELLQAGEVELAFSSTEVAWEAYHGEFTFEGNPQEKLRTLVPGWPGVWMFVTLEENGIETIYDLDGKSYSSGPMGSGNEVFASRVFDTFGINPDIQNLPTSDAASALKDGLIDGFSIAWPSEAIIELETGEELNLITISGEESEQFLEENPPYPELSIPPNVYNAIPDGKDGLGLYNLLLVSSEISVDQVYDILETIYENESQVEQVWPQMASGMSYDNVGETTIPYHPGAIKYFEDQGIEIPEDLKPE